MALAFRTCHHRLDRENSQARRQEIEALHQEFSSSKTNLTPALIPSPSIFATLNKAGGNAEMPTVGECAAHLELLEAFFVLKQKILTSNALDRAFGIAPKPTLETVGRVRRVKEDATFEARRAVKWPIFIQLAVARFMKWWHSLDVILATQSASRSVNIDEKTIPPLDVLMVWHALLLNPAVYKKMLQHSAFPEKYRMQLPWAIVHATLIDNRGFHAAPPARAIFEKNVGRYDLYNFLANHSSHTDAFKLALQGQAASDSYKQTPLAISHPGLEHLPSYLGWTESIGPLSGMVERQAKFAEKMAGYLWLRSPALRGTLERAAVRYRGFMALFKEEPAQTLVPTADIDLVWHTHQCSPREYEAGCVRMAGRFINHDDGLSKRVLKGGFGETRVLYEARFKDGYGVCLCWECEATRTEMERLDPGDDDVDFDAIAKKVQDAVRYHKAVELVRRGAI